MSNGLVGGGRFIVFEGPDGAGKSTQIQRVSQELEKLQQKVVVLTDPDYEVSGVGGMLKQHLAGESKLDEVAARQTFALGRRLNQPKLVESLQAGCTVLCDRYAYSGVACGLAKAELKGSAAPPELQQSWLQGLDQGLVKPDLVVYFRIAPEAAAARGGDYGNQLYEKQPFQEALVKVLEANVATWEMQPIDAKAPEEDVTRQILSLISAITPPRGRKPLFHKQSCCVFM